MWIELEMCLRLATEYLHLVLIKTFVRAELELRRSIVEVHIAHSVSDALAEVASLGTLEGRSSPREEAVLGTKDCALRSNNLRRLPADFLMTPRASVS